MKQPRRCGAVSYFYFAIRYCFGLVDGFDVFVVFDFEVVSPGTMIHFPAQPIWTGESVGTLKSLIFLDGEGEPIGNEHLLKPTVALQ